MRKRYKMVSIPKEHPFYCMTRKGRVAEHRLIVAEQLGRPLTGREIVHHKDNNSENNNHDNLFLTNRRDHEVITKRDSLRMSLSRARKHITAVKRELGKMEKMHEKLFSDI